MSAKTRLEYDSILKKCRDIFEKKMLDYGSAWRILRLSSLTDQIFIKAQRIKTLETTGRQMVNEGIVPEYIGIVNYSIMAMVQADKGVVDAPDINALDACKLWDNITKLSSELMEKKNHDYGEAWRDMRISSLTDLILQKLLRIKQIEDNDGSTLISEGIESNYLDIINYAIFALIKLETENK